MNQIFTRMGDGEPVSLSINQVREDLLADECLMRDVREEFGIGTITAVPGTPKGIRAKQRIAALLGIGIHSVDKMWHR